MFLNYFQVVLSTEHETVTKSNLEEGNGAHSDSLTTVTFTKTSKICKEGISESGDEGMQVQVWLFYFLDTLVLSKKFHIKYTS